MKYDTVTFNYCMNSQTLSPNHVVTAVAVVIRPTLTSLHDTIVYIKTNSRHYWEFHQQTTSWRQRAVGEYRCRTSCVCEWCAENTAFAWWRRPAAPAPRTPLWQCSSSPASSTGTPSTDTTQQSRYTCLLMLNAIYFAEITLSKRLTMRCKQNRQHTGNNSTQLNSTSIYGRRW